MAPSGRQAIGMSLWARRDDADRGHSTSGAVMHRLAQLVDEIEPAQVFQVWSRLRQASVLETAAYPSAPDERERLQMQVAREVQERLYPRNEVELPGCAAAGTVVPAEVMCGDYYDHFPMADDGLGLAIGDVSGHGFGPSLIMVQTRAYLRSFSQACPNLSTVIERLNETLVCDLSSERFVTLLVVRLDLADHALHYINAGHLTGYVLDRDGNVRLRLASTGPPLGLFAGRRYPASRRLALEEGDIVALFTDGVTESTSADGEEFGVARALAYIRDHRHLPASDIAAGLAQSARTFAVHAPQVDDMTAFISKLD
jgi:sigma-B regulation protein RsbU (phosphoserine phosphatase)